MSLTEFPVVKNLDQTVWLAFAVVTGAVFCLVYEILKAFRAEIPHKNISVFFEDVLFFDVLRVWIFLLCSCSATTE